MFLEDDLLNIHVLEPDSKMARVRLEALVKVLAFRNPAKYSQRLDVSVNQTISIRHALENSNVRIIDLVRGASTNENTPLLGEVLTQSQG